MRKQQGRSANGRSNVDVMSSVERMRDVPRRDVRWSAVLPNYVKKNGGRRKRGRKSEGGKPRSAPRTLPLGSWVSSEIQNEEEEEEEDIKD